ncbi:DUF5682 family protein [Kineococcus rhizosphaerae]|uniref:Uncharacterized protein n=1 Tax=Kineococcus rhizosphaerae TaxID=559628 RepID=A0A2T0R528_9ACTN|nr:DUF5682 family protein [Kineococcus rhizosphaerae]PRY15817.1 hypothetical protein CLV37_10426 [Kineococcus rhizosphaerae]
MTVRVPTVRVLGVRHHGPGSARSVRAALEEFDPGVVLVEGPADADALVEFVGAADMQPPVALLAHPVDAPDRAVFWPFAVFSPEWQAMTWACERGVPVRFCDLPAAQLLTRTDEDEPLRGARLDPIGTLAATAGYDDPERWWEDLVENRPTSPAGDDVFDGLTEAMGALREDTGPEAETDHERRREAHMRQVLRRAVKEHERVAVVCGAWHAPALTAPLPKVAEDTAVLRGAAKVKVALTWVPWTHGRLAAASGYGAGITSPGWYHHLFAAPDAPVVRWLTAVARVLREEDLPVSSASVIEAVRLAETLAVLRGRPLAGLAEVTEATAAVLCEGNETLLGVVTRRLVVGELLGEVPASAPTMPLEADLRLQQKAVRLKPDAAVRELDLDLREDSGRARSVLLHRLRLLGIDWGTPATPAVRSTGTFREPWALQWRPELAVDLVTASRWGTTVAGAATTRVVARAVDGDLPAVTAAVEDCLRADLPAALPQVLAALDERAAHDHDLAHLMDAVPPLVRALRYGDVRGTGAAALQPVTTALLVRVCTGLGPATNSLDDDAAAAVQRRVDAVDDAVDLLADADLLTRWRTALAALLDRPDLHPLLAGRIVRLLQDAGALAAGETSRRLSRALSRPPAQVAPWVEGFLSGGGVLLVHDRDLLDLLDGWLTALADEEFLAVLPLVRRTFSTFAVGERRQIGAALSRDASPRAAVDVDLSSAAAQAAVRAVARFLGSAS